MKHMILSVLATAALVADTFTLHSNDLEGQISIEQVYNGFGCTGKNISPELHWENAPKGTKSFAITVYDPDAPTGSGWWHWLIVNVSKESTSISSNASGKGDLPKGAVETMTDYGSSSFGGACPPEGDGTHAYIFTVHALDIDKLDVAAKTDSALVGYMINKHTIEKASLVSYYKR